MKKLNYLFMLGILSISLVPFSNNASEITHNDLMTRPIEGLNPNNYTPEEIEQQNKLFQEKYNNEMVQYEQVVKENQELRDFYKNNETVDGRFKKLKENYDPNFPYANGDLVLSATDSVKVAGVINIETGKKIPIEWRNDRWVITNLPDKKTTIRVFYEVINWDAKNVTHVKGKGNVKYIGCDVLTNKTARIELFDNSWIERMHHPHLTSTLGITFPLVPRPDGTVGQTGNYPLTSTVSCQQFNYYTSNGTDITPTTNVFQLNFYANVHLENNIDPKWDDSLGFTTLKGSPENISFKDKNIKLRYEKVKYDIDGKIQYANVGRFTKETIDYLNKAYPLNIKNKAVSSGSVSLLVDVKGDSIVTLGNLQDIGQTTPTPSKLSSQVRGNGMVSNGALVYRDPIDPAKPVLFQYEMPQPSQAQQPTQVPEVRPTQPTTIIEKTSPTPTQSVKTGTFPTALLLVSVIIGSMTILFVRKILK